MKGIPAITLLSIALFVFACSDSPKEGRDETSSAEVDWMGSELLSMVVKLKGDTSREEVSTILGGEVCAPLDHGKGCIEAFYVKDPDSFIGRQWVSGGPHSFTGLTAKFIDDRLVYISLNPGYVDQDRLDAYYEEHPVNHEGSDLRGRKRWELFHETQSSRRKQGEQDGAEQPTTAPESKPEGEENTNQESEVRRQ